MAAAGAHDRDSIDLSCIYLLPWKQQLVPDLEALAVPTTCLDVRNERDPRWAGRLRKLLSDNPVDILHAHSPYPAGIARLAVRSLPARIRPRLVYTLHNTTTSFAAATRVLNNWTMRLDDIDLAVSDEVRTTLPHSLAARTEVLVHGIDLNAVQTQRDRAGVRAELGIGPDEIVFGTVANLRAQKDYPNLLAAARLLRDRDVAIRFITVGQGPLDAEIRSERETLDLVGSVAMLGERRDAVRVMSACDGFVLASSNEGLPVALMEALALGLPIVATDVGGVSEALTDGKNAVLVPAKDPVALADAIAGLASDPARSERMATAAAAESGRFDISRTVSRLEDIYHSLILTDESPQ